MRASALSPPSAAPSSAFSTHILQAKPTRHFSAFQHPTVASNNHYAPQFGGYREMVTLIGLTGALTVLGVLATQVRKPPKGAVGRLYPSFLGLTLPFPIAYIKPDGRVINGALRIPHGRVLPNGTAKNLLGITVGKGYQDGRFALHMIPGTGIKSPFGGRINLETGKITLSGLKIPFGRLKLSSTAQLTPAQQAGLAVFLPKWQDAPLGLLDS